MQRVWSTGVGDAVTRAAGLPLDEIVRREVFESLAMRQSVLVPRAAATGASTFRDVERQ